MTINPDPTLAKRTRLIPTPAQAELLRIYTGQPPTSQQTTAQTREVCRMAGWTRAIDPWPYIEVTNEGRLALQRYEAANPTAPPLRFSGAQITRFDTANVHVPIADPGDVAALLHQVWPDLRFSARDIHCLDSPRGTWRVPVPEEAWQDAGDSAGVGWARDVLFSGLGSVRIDLRRDI